ncbi:unnamed protein product [Moneuplotes crassus]|uniref:Uncharacterized protein n=1 Tax=Euplotes crassus TaxID=5936 RepID=A0AAD1U9E6_EUPCR|nr:unnamed protein product [Moneuplotes crassus]
MNMKFVCLNPLCLYSIEKLIFSNNRGLSFIRCNNAYYNIFEKEIDTSLLESGFEESSEHGEIYECLYDQRFIKFVYKLELLNLFGTSNITLVTVDCKRKQILYFINHCFPKKVNNLEVSSGMCLREEISDYYNPLIQLSFKVVKKVSFIKYKINEMQLKKIISAFRHVYELGLVSCELSVLSVPNFSRALSNCQIETLNLNQTEWSLNCYLKSNVYEFKYLVQGLASSSDLRLSLKTIYICVCGITQKEIEELLIENQLVRVEIINKKCFSLKFVMSSGSNYLKIQFQFSTVICVCSGDVSSIHSCTFALGIQYSQILSS